MNAKRCNRCWNYYSPALLNGESAEITEIFFHTGSDVQKGTFSERMAGIDLCQRCALDFRRFMDGCVLKIDDNDFDRPDAENSPEEHGS